MHFQKRNLNEADMQNGSEIDKSEVVEMTTMNIAVASMLCWLIVLIQAGILFAFKKFCLNKISGVLKYLLGMLLAYGLLFLLYYGSYCSDDLTAMLQEGRVFVLYGPNIFGIVMIVIPAIYSAFLIEKGYFGEGRKEASWKWKLKMMASVLLNGLISFFALLSFNLLLKGHSIGELTETAKESLQYIDWLWMFAFAATCALFVFVMWLNHKK